jgi:hypothetical protein
MRALEDAVAISDRISELAGIADPADSRESGFAQRPATEFNSVDGAWSGKVQVDAGPISDFAQLTEIEDTFKSVEAVSSVSVRGVSNNRAALSVQVDEPTALIEEIRRNIPFEVKLTEVSPGSLSIEIVDHESGSTNGQLKAA